MPPNNQKPWQSASDEDKQIARPCSAQALAAYQALDTPLLDVPFDPNGAWQLSYYIWMSGGAFQSYRGRQILERQPRPDGGFTLKVRQDWIADRQRAVHETTATISCRADNLGTPLTWELKSRVYDVKTDTDFAEATVHQTGRTTAAGVEVTTNGSRASHSVMAPWITNWSVFEAVQRLPRTLPEPVAFTLLEGLDTVKPAHRLFSRGTEEVTFSGRPVATTRYDQIGRACLPCVYHVDGLGRTLLAYTALRAYILNPDVDAIHEKKVKYLATKELQ